MTDKEIDKEWLAEMRENFERHPYKSLNSALTLYDTVQGEEIETENRLRTMLQIQGDFVSPEERDRVQKIIDQQEEFINFVKKNLKTELAKIPIYNEILSRIPYLGDLACARLINYVRIDRAGSISALRKYCGYSAGEDGKIIHEESGKTRDFNKSLKPVFYLWARRCIMSKSEPFNSMYRTWKEYYHNREPELAPFIVDRRAIIKVVGIFIGSLWLAWRELEGLPTKSPYAQAKLGHPESHIITIERWLAPKVEVKVRKKRS